MISEASRRDAVETAREMILNALEIIQEAVKDTGLENTVRERIIRIIEPVVIYSDPISDLERDTFGIDSLLEMMTSVKSSNIQTISNEELSNVPEDLEMTMNLEAFEDD